MLLVAPRAHGLHILIERLRGVDLQFRVVGPLVGIADFHVERGEFLVGVLLRGVAHPFLRVDALAEGHLQVLHERFHLLFRGGREVAVAIHLAEGLAHCALHLVRGALPERIVLFAARHRLAEEVEVGLANLVGEQSGGSRNHVPLHVGAQVVGGHGGHQLVGSFDELGLSDDDFLHILALDALGVGHLLKREVGQQRLHLGQRHLVVVGLRVAQLGAALGNQRQRGLEAEHGVALGLGLLFRESEELEHAGNVLLVGLADFHGGLVVVQIIVFLPQRQAALVDVQNVHRDVLLVGSKSVAKRHAIALGSVFQLYFRERVLRLGGLHLVEQRLHGCDALAVTAVGIHRQLVEVREFALVRALGKRLFLQLVENRVDALVVVLLQLVEAAETRESSGQRVVLLPATSCKHVEVLCGLHGAVKIFHLEPRLVLCHSCHGQRQHQSHRNHFTHFHFSCRF